jgi:hypothetical protein
VPLKLHRWQPEIREPARDARAGVIRYNDKRRSSLARNIEERRRFVSGKQWRSRVQNLNSPDV